jgi:GNAT superfamily N-acetyltransferase
MPAEVDRFVHVDHHDREALVAISDDDIVAVARFDRLPGTTGAEVAFVVADAWQGLGLGTRMYAALADRARREGIQQLIAETLGDNRRMLAVFHHTGRVVRTSMDAGVIRLVLDVEPEVA